MTNWIDESPGMDGPGCMFCPNDRDKINTCHPPINYMQISSNPLDKLLTTICCTNGSFQNIVQTTFSRPDFLGSLITPQLSYVKLDDTRWLTNDCNLGILHEGILLPRAKEYQ